MPELLFPCQPTTTQSMIAFAVYKNQVVVVEGIEGNEAEISFDDGGEAIVEIEELDFLS